MLSEQAKDNFFFSQNAKCDYGFADDTDFFSVAVPKLDRRYKMESMGILDGEVKVGR